MPRRSLAQLDAAVVLRALGEQIQDFAADAAYPVDRTSAVDEPEDLQLARTFAFPRPVDDRAHGGVLAVGDARRADLQPVDVQMGEQHPGDLQLLRGGEGDSGRLFAVAERGIQHFNR